MKELRDLKDLTIHDLQPWLIASARQKAPWRAGNRRVHLQGNLAHKKTHPARTLSSLIRKCTHLGPYRRPIPRVLGGSQGAAVSYERGTPVRRIRRECFLGAER